ncbi:hypothetical protein EVAR_92269_1 [Eumeta japonica]|uniref:Uncharacterized protein n=1 Tax=Eumeta variegata TaxID=151549 RepID=A0A4C1TMF9_EUMVA|nr:hypothetical protein EVAR_92269_1 [Eumeta japonica]
MFQSALEAAAHRRAFGRAEDLPIKRSPSPSSALFGVKPHQDIGRSRPLIWISPGNAAGFYKDLPHVLEECYEFPRKRTTLVSAIDVRVEKNCCPEIIEDWDKRIKFLSFYEMMIK